MTGKLSKNFHGVGIGPLSNMLAVKLFFFKKRLSTGILQTVANIDFLNADLSNLRRLLSTIDVLMKSKISSRDLIQQNAIEDPFVLSQHGYNGGVNNSIKYLITFETKQAPSFQQH